MGVSYFCSNRRYSNRYVVAYLLVPLCFLSFSALRPVNSAMSAAPSLPLMLPYRFTPIYTTGTFLAIHGPRVLWTAP